MDVVRLDVLGVRGSTGAPGPDFVRYGGHTSCIAVTPDGATVPTLVLDAGTGLRSLTGRLGGRACDDAQDEDPVAPQEVGQPPGSDEEARQHDVVGVESA